MNDIELMNTTNAETWAEEFLERTNTVEGMAEETVLGWFASAIGAGISHGQSPVAMMDIEKACEIMHDAYEEAAPGSGWKTNPESRKPWAEVPEANKQTMRAAVEALRRYLLNGKG